MSDDEYSDGSPPPAAAKGAAGGGAKPKDKRLSVERIYQKKSQLEHILLRPDTYIGSVQPTTESMWIYENEAMVNREITYVPGFYKIFDEILVNAADNKQRDPKMDTIKIEIKQEENIISVMNNGKGIPVVMHKEENMYVPTMIFGHLLTSSNFNDEEEKVTGGRNGFGAKLCNVFSTKFTVETADKKVKKSFKQTWGANMSKAGEAKIKDFSGEEFTKITFSPDLKKFNMEKLDDDVVALLHRRAFDIAASTKGVKVFLNGKRLPVKNFKDYVDQYIKGKVDDKGDQIKCVYEQCGPRWEIAVCVSDKGFQQMSFVNSIATTKGGKHVDHVADTVIKGIIEKIKKNNKTGVNIKNFQVKNHLWLFVNCLIVNPTFDSQTKETMTLGVKDFGSKCTPSDKFQTALQKSGIIEAVLEWSKFKADMQLKNKASGKKTNKLHGVAKLDDANEAGTKNSSGCTLILTEGDSAKTLATSGIAVVGRDYYGVYPLKGKLLNVREASHKQIMENKEINDLVKIIGLKYKQKYTTMDDLKTLRYGKVMIMTDQDQDGSHIKGLLINFIHYNWPSLLNLPFLEEFITPIVKVTKGTQVLSFYSIPEFQEWKEATENHHTWKVKYYKGLGSSSAKEAREYFSDMARHKIKFRYGGSQDDHSIQLAFSKKFVEQRKEWLTNWMEEGKRRKELGLPEVYLYEKDTKAVNYTDFVNKELVLFSNMDNERSLPSMVDGFKPGQRKVLFTALKKNIHKKEVKVAQLAGAVGELSAYHHGEASLMGTIVNLAQDYVGSNNINVLLPIGQFGTRLAGGKDSASARYISTQLSPLASHIFNKNDEPLLNYLMDDNIRIEPEWYIPIIPMVLVNGADGIGTGWMTKIPNFNPREIVDNLKRLIRGEEPKLMMPWFKGFTGTIEALDSQKFVMNGEIATLSDTKVEITELPVRTWTSQYKEMLETMLVGNEKAPAVIQDYKDYSTDTTVKFIVQMSQDKMRAAEREKGLHTFFKLQTTISTTSMVLFDHLGCLRKFETVEEILREFYTLRLEFYGKRKRHMEGILTAELVKLSNQARFILEKCDGTLSIENKKKKVMIDELVRRGYDSDPIKAWKKTQSTLQEEEEAAAEDSETESPAGGPDYDYLLGMKLWSLTEEKKNELLKQKEDKSQELKILQGTSEKSLWTTDLDAFLVALDELEKKDKKSLTDEADKLALGKKAGKGGKPGKSRVLAESLPTPQAIRVEPRIADDLKVKIAKAVAAKDRKLNKKDKDAIKSVMDEKDEFDLMAEDKEMNKSLSERLGLSGEKKKLKQTKLKFEKKSSAEKSSPKKKGKNPWSDDEDDDVSGSDLSDVVDEPIIPREKAGSRRAAAAVAKYNLDESDEHSSDGSEDLFDNDGVKETGHKAALKDDGSDSEPSFSASSPPPKKKPAPKPKPAAEKPKPKPKPLSDSEDDVPSKKNGVNGHKKDEEEDVFNVSDSDSDGDFAARIKAKSTKAPPKKLVSSDDLFDSMLGSEEKKKPVSKPPPARRDDSDLDSDDFMPKKKAAPAKKKKVADSDSDDEAPKPKKKAAPKPKADKPKADKPKAAPKPRKKKVVSDSDDEKPKAKKAKGKKGSDSGSDLDFSDAGDIGPARDRPGRARQPVSYKGADASDDESDY